MVETVQGREVTIVFDGKRCVHSRNCVLSHPEVFVPNVKGEWIYPDAAPAAEVVRIGQNCPSGAIRVLRNDGAAGSDAPPVVNTLRVRENGPLALEAPILLGGVALDGAARHSVSLWRFGQQAVLRRQPHGGGVYRDGRACGEGVGRLWPRAMAWWRCSLCRTGR